MTALIANALSEPWRISVAPPPGLVTSVVANVSADEKRPNEVPHRRQRPSGLANTISAGGGSRTSSSNPELAHVSASQKDRLLKCSRDSSDGDGNVGGVWEQAVLDLAPHLDAEQLHHALRILDQAIVNSQHAKALEQIKLQELQFGGHVGFFPSFPGIPLIGSSTEYLQIQVQEQQRLLFAELQQLRNLARSMSARAAKSAANSHEKQHSKSSQQFRTQAAKHPTSDDARAQTQQASDRQRKQEPRPGARQAQTLSTSLQMLSNEDPSCLFIVRRINKLRFKAARKLKQHFSSYGSVVRVLVAHSTVHQHGDPQSHTRRRPSSLGFVHMASPDAVIKVLAVGTEHSVDGSLIRVQRFERQQSEAAALEAAEAEGAEEEEKLDEEDEVTEEDLGPKATGKKPASQNSHRRKIVNNQDPSWARQQSAASGTSTATGSTITSTDSDTKPDSE